MFFRVAPTGSSGSIKGINLWNNHITNVWYFLLSSC